MGNKSDRCRRQGEGGFVGVAVEIQRVENELNFGHRKRRRSRGCRRFESCHSDQKKENYTKCGSHFMYYSIFIIYYSVYF